MWLSELYLAFSSLYNGETAPEAVSPSHWVEEEEGERGGGQARTPYIGVSRILLSVAGRKRGGARGGMTRVGGWWGPVGPVLEDSRLEGMLSNWRPQGGGVSYNQLGTGGPETGGDLTQFGSLKAGGSIDQHRWRAELAFCYDTAFGLFNYAF